MSSSFHRSSSFKMENEWRISPKKICGNISVINIYDKQLRDYFELCFLQDCTHVSKTREEFYSVRCTVADMKSLYVCYTFSPVPPIIHSVQHQMGSIKDGPLLQ